jgi:hypothetical protein
VPSLSRRPRVTLLPRSRLNSFLGISRALPYHASHAIWSPREARAASSARPPATAGQTLVSAELQEGFKKGVGQAEVEFR